MKPVRLVSLLVLTSAALSARATLIDFDDAPDGALTTYYSGLGVTFTNAQIASTLGSFSGASSPNVLIGDHSNVRVSQTHPIGASFAAVQSSVSLTGADVGAAGFILKAYDAANVLIDSASVTGTGLGFDEFYTLTVTGAISRIEFSQIAPDGEDGSVYDNLIFTSASSVPGPAAALPFALLAVKRRRAAKK